MKRFVQVVFVFVVAAQTVFGIKLGGNFYIKTSSVPNGTVGVAYSLAFSVNDGTAPYSWSKSAGTLPAGLTLSSGGVLSGTPTIAATYSFTVKVVDKKGRSYQQSYSCIISSAPAPSPTLKITTTALPGGTVGTPYSTAVAATGGTSPYTWSVTSGSLPAGLSFAASTGVISGTPTLVGTSSLTIQVADASMPGQTYSLAYSLTISTAPVSQTLKITTTSLQSSEVGIAYPLQTMTATGGTAPYTWNVISAKGSTTGWLAPACGSFSTCVLLPTVSLVKATGVISGVNGLSDTFNLVIEVTDSSSPAQSYQAAYSVYIAPTLMITGFTQSGGGIGGLYTFTPTATGGVPPYTWSISTGALPSCYTLDTSTGVISGTCNSTGSYDFSLSVSDSMSVTYP